MVYKSDVVWLFHQYLGRSPKSDEAIDAHLKFAGGDIQKLKQKIFTSDESKNKGFLSSSTGYFCHYADDPAAPKILVLGNCQAPNLARLIADATGSSVLGLEVMGYTANPTVFDEACEAADVILTAILSDSFGTISTSRLKATYGARKNVSTYSSVHFTGQHPDMVYWGTSGKRFQSPMGDYHSRIVLRSFLGGSNVVECLGAFNEANFEALKYYTACQRSFDEWQRREANADIKICDLAKEQWKDRQLMLTINHPKGWLLRQLCSGFLEQSGIGAKAKPSQFFVHTLYNGPIWPVHPLIADRHGFTFDFSPFYWRSGAAMTHDEFVHRCYAMYASYDREALLASGADYQMRDVLG